MTNGRARRQLSGLASRLDLGGMVCGCVAGLMLVAGCSQAPAPVDTKAAEDAVRAEDVAWSKAAQAHDLAAVLSYYASDAVVLAPNTPILTSAQAIHDGWAPMMTPDVSVALQPTTITAAASGDVVYGVGTYMESAKDAHGKTVNDTGKYVCVWKKQADGSWKAEVDTWNSDLPAVAPAPVAKKKRG